MTIKELHEWALANNVEDFKLRYFDEWAENANDVKVEQLEIYKKEKVVLL